MTELHWWALVCMGAIKHISVLVLREVIVVGGGGWSPRWCNQARSLVLQQWCLWGDDSVVWGDSCWRRGGADHWGDAVRHVVWCCNKWYLWGVDNQVVCWSVINFVVAVKQILILWIFVTDGANFLSAAAGIFTVRQAAVECGPFYIWFFAAAARAQSLLVFFFFSHVIHM
jgi:hypothetical protein